MATSAMDMGGKQYFAGSATGDLLTNSRDSLTTTTTGYVDGDDGLVHSDASADPLAGGTARGLPIWNVNQIAEHLNRTGQSWKVNQQGEYDDGVLTFGFWKSIEELQSSYYVNNDGSIAFNEAFYGEDFSPFTAAQQTMAIKGLALWGDLANVKFQQIAADANTATADITFGNTYTGPASQAYAYLPFGDIYNDFYAQFGFDSVNKLGGDVWTNGFLSSNFFPTKDSYYAQTTLIHELGHALGLSHPGDYNADGNQELSYALADYYQDSNQYSIMSYWDAYETGAQHIDWTLTNFAYAATPLVHDIAAIQRIYGANMETRTGDTVYGFNSTADRSAFDFTLNTRPIVSIWDAGGNDTLDFSGWNTPSIIDLNAGAFSSGGGTIAFPSLAEVNANRAAAGLPPRDQATYDFYVNLRNELGLTNGLYKDNISIAYGATIENAIGGGGDDLLIANQVANKLTGNGGSDTVSYQTATSAVQVNLARNTATGGAAGDTFFSIENLTGSAFGDTLSGTSASNTLNGAAGDDRLVSFGGVDILNGGDGIDTADFGDGSPSGVTVNLTKGTATTSAGVTTLISIENIRGTRLDDVINGDNFANSIKGETGNDRLDGGGGDDILQGDGGDDVLIGALGNDVIAGGVGTDTVDYGTSFVGVTVNLAIVKAQNTIGAGIDTIVGVENLGGSRGDDILRGDAGINTIKGSTGNDQVFGAGGDDILFGDGGDDVLNGGTGYDVLGGGAGTDRFVFDSLDGDLIRDWTTGEKIDATALHAHAFNIVTKYGRATVSFDVDGDGQFDDGFFTVQTASLTASDILI